MYEALKEIQYVEGGSSRPKTKSSETPPSGGSHEDYIQMSQLISPHSKQSQALEAEADLHCFSSGTKSEDELEENV